MLTRSFVRSAFVLLSAACELATAEPTSTTMRATVDPDQGLVTVELVRDGELHGDKLKRIAESQVFEATLADPFANADSSVLTAPYLLTAQWSSSPSEVLYLEFKRGALRRFEVNVLSIKSAGKREEIEQIERLGKDNYADQIKRFFWARSYYKYLRDIQQLVTHQNAVRGAKEWFDASYWLASRKLSVFRVDQEAVDVMTAYAERAKRDPSFKRTFTSIVRAGYFQGMLNELNTIRFDLAAQVQAYVSRGEVQAAKELNEALQQQLEQLSAEEQRQVRVYRGITIELLGKNGQYLATLDRSSAM